MHDDVAAGGADTPSCSFTFLKGPEPEIEHHPHFQLDQSFDQPKDELFARVQPSIEHVSRYVFAVQVNHPLIDGETYGPLLILQASSKGRLSGTCFATKEMN